MVKIKGSDVAPQKTMPMGASNPSSNTYIPRVKSAWSQASGIFKKGFESSKAAKKKLDSTLIGQTVNYLGRKVDNICWRGAKLLGGYSVVTGGAAYGLRTINAHLPEGYKYSLVRVGAKALGNLRYYAKGSLPLNMERVLELSAQHANKLAEQPYAEAIAVGIVGGAALYGGYKVYKSFAHKKDRPEAPKKENTDKVTPLQKRGRPQKSKKIKK